MLVHVLEVWVGNYLPVPVLNLRVVVAFLCVFFTRPLFQFALVCRSDATISTDAANSTDENQSDTSDIDKIIATATGVSGGD